MASILGAYIANQPNTLPSGGGLLGRVTNGVKGILAFATKDLIKKEISYIFNVSGVKYAKEASEFGTRVSGEEHEFIFNSVLTFIETGIFFEVIDAKVKSSV